MEPEVELELIIVGTGCIEPVNGNRENWLYSPLLYIKSSI